MRRSQSPLSKPENLRHRLVQDLRLGDEVQTLAGRKKIKWIGYNKFTKEEGRAWQDGVMPIQIAYDQLAERAEAMLV